MTVVPPITKYPSFIPSPFTTTPLADIRPPLFSLSPSLTKDVSCFFRVLQSVVIIPPTFPSKIDTQISR